MRALLWILRVVAVLLVVVIGGFFILKAFGLRVEMTGTGMTPIFTFHDPEDHYEAIEEERAAERLETAVEPTVPPAEASEPESGEVAPAEAAAVSAPWPYYRGPRRDGVPTTRRPSAPPGPRTSLPEVWRTKIGGGYASMVVAQGLVYTIEQRRDKEVVAAYDLGTGLQRWEHGWDGLFTESMGGPGPRATPTWSGGVLYALGALGEFRALDAKTGKMRWRRNILEDAGVGNLTWGMSGAPLFVDGKVIVFPGGSNNKSVIAYNAADGSIAWTSQGDKGGYASPRRGNARRQAPAALLQRHARHGSRPHRRRAVVGASLVLE